MATAPEMTVVHCPGCATKVQIMDLRAGSVTCPGCSREWRIRLQDVPGGRFLIDLAPLGN